MSFALQRSGVVSLALAAMLLRALLPDGWMPGTAAAPLTICSVNVGHLDASEHGAKLPTGQGHTHAPCAFAAMAPLAPPALAPFALPVTTESSRAVLSFIQDRAGASRLFRPNIARAPPVLA